MKDNTMSKLGGTCSILLGVSYMVIGITYFLLPPELQEPLADGKFMTAYAQNPLMLNVEDWAFALGGLLAIAAVLAISDSVRSANEGWVRWTSSLALVGFAALAISYFRFLALAPDRAAAYVQGDAALKAALTVPPAPLNGLGLDPQGWLEFGAVGLWILVVSLFALRGGTWPKPLAYVGVGLAIVYWLVVAAIVLKMQLLIAIAAGVGSVLLAPIWYIWLGLRLRKAS